MSDEDWMRKLITIAKQAEADGGLPLAAIIVKNDEIVAEAHSLPGALRDPSNHSEIDCIREYAKNYGMDYAGCTIYGVIEPCSMCLGSYLWAGIPRAVFGAYASDISGNSYEYSDYSSNELAQKAAAPFEISGGVLREECKELFASYKNWQKI